MKELQSMEFKTEQYYLAYTRHKQILRGVNSNKKGWCIFKLSYIKTQNTSCRRISNWWEEMNGIVYNYRSIPLSVLQSNREYFELSDEEINTFLITRNI